ncbi:hypothetical protein EVG20_g10643 [Dentipellis fragilis]|uniref:Uncharacterized protein n=1 Tax=Dentipellis fragilis TaxID=205917 RepID=A0A4Y9XS59_9AGAM|nr:hypothetical protein EVG20_g10643 [Dentipellis fragilis]
MRSRSSGGPGVDPHSIPLAVSMTSFVLSHTRESQGVLPPFVHPSLMARSLVLLFVHRIYFTLVLLEEPTNTFLHLRSPMTGAAAQQSRDERATFV